ncbi:MAG: hypothetical protein IPJ81_13975 [Chitinophagaceae bacterium]|nr:hypothetical protein [Chitinophagaceae bacterium]
MKKIFFSIIGFVGLVFSARAQVITTSPASFTAEDEVKIMVDVSNVPALVNVEPLYLWTWFPSEPPPGNGQWEASNEERKMTKEGPNKWSVTFKPTDFYGKPPAEITQIKFLVKAKNATGDLKTPDITINVDPLVYTPSVFRTFPKVIGKNEIVTVYLDQNLAPDLITQRMKPSTAEISLFKGADQVGITKTVNLKDDGNKLWSYTFFPLSFFNLPATTVIDKLKIKFKGVGTDAEGNPIPAESPVFEKGLDDLK